MAIFYPQKILTTNKTEVTFAYNNYSSMIFANSGTDGVTIDSKLKPKIDDLFADRDGLTLDEWDSEVRADEDDNRLYKFYRYIIGEMLDLKTLKSMVKDYSKKK